MAFERAENAKRTESMELQKAAGDMKFSQLNLLVGEQKALLVEREAQLQRLEGEVKSQQRINDNLTSHKSHLEYEVHQCQAKLELVMADKAAREQELSHSKLLIEQAEAKWSMAQRKLDDLVNKNQDLWNQSPKFQRKKIEEMEKENVQSGVQAHMLLPVDVHSSESHSNIVKEYQKVKEDLQQKFDELDFVQKRAEISEEKAQSYKKLLDDRDNRLKKLHLDMEAERFSLRKKSEDLHGETLTMQRTISELQEEVKSLHRAKSSLEQDVFFQNTEVDGLKEHLKITQGEIHRRGSVDQDNIQKISNLEEELSSKQMLINQLHLKCAELRRLSTSSESDLRALQLHTSAVEKEKTYLEQKIKSQKSEIQRSIVELQEAKEEVAVMKRSEQECLFKCKGLEAGIQNCEFVASQLQKKADESKQVNADLENTLKSTREKHDQVLMEIDRKDQQIEILKSQVEAAKSQIRIIEGELNNKSLCSHEQNCTFNSNVMNFEREIATVKSDLKSALAKNEIAEHRVRMQNAEIDDLNTILKNKNDEIQKGSTVINKHLSKVKALEDELFKYEHDVKGAARNSDKMTGNLKQEILVLQMDKKSAEKNVEQLNVKVSELSSALRKVKEELEKESKDRKNKEFIIAQLECDLTKNKTALGDELSNLDQSKLNLHDENVVLQREKTDALEKSVSLASDIILLKEKLKCNQAEDERLQKENFLLGVRSQLMEEQVAKCKRMLEELKTKLELQKQGYERHLMLVQNEMEKKVMSTQLVKKNEMEVSQTCSHGSELQEMFTEYLKGEVQVLKSAPQNISESKEQVDVRIDKMEQERIAHEQDLLEIRWQIAQPQEETLNLYSKVNAIESKESSPQLSRDGSWKVTAKEASSQPGQILLDLKEEKESQNFRKLEGPKGSQQYLIDSAAAILKTDNTAMQKLDTQLKELEILQMKSSLEMKKLQNKDIPKQFNPYNMNINPSRTTVARPISQNITLPHNASTTGTSQIYSSRSPAQNTQGYMALCEPSEYQRQKHSIFTTTTYKLQETPEASVTSVKSHPESRNRLILWNTTALSLEDLKESPVVQHLIKYKLLDNDIFHKLEMGITTIDKVQASIAPYVSKPPVIAGVYVESSKKKISFLEAAQKGFLAKVHAMEFLQAQVAIGSLTDLSTGHIYTLNEALEEGILESTLQDKLMLAENAFSGYSHVGKKLSVFQAMEAGILERYKGKKILEVQIATGGVINPEGGFRMPASLAIDHGFLNKETLQFLHDPVRNPKGFHNPDTGQKAYYAEILKMCLYDIDGDVLLLPLGDRHLTHSSPSSSHRVSVISSSRGTEMSAHEAFKKKHIVQQIYMFLSQQESEWQEVSSDDAGNGSPHVISDVKNGRTLCLESALSQRFLEASEFEQYRSGLLSIYEIADLIFSRMVVVEDAHSPIAGLWDLNQKKRLSVLQGFQQGLTDGMTALRLLEAQACTGGICDPFSGEKFTISDAISKGLLNEKLAQQLQHFEQSFNGITHPKTGKVVSITQAVQENLLPKDVGARCIEFQLLTGGLVHPETHDRISPEEVFQKGLVDKTTVSAIKDVKSHTKSLTCPKAKRRITFNEALERSVYDCHTGLRLLEAAKAHDFGALSAFHHRKLK
ncbi:uncharacterized protein LOC144084710 [Stigmatopora argus]